MTVRLWPLIQRQFEALQEVLDDLCLLNLTNIVLMQDRKTLAVMLHEASQQFIRSGLLKASNWVPRCNR